MRALIGSNLLARSYLLLPVARSALSLASRFVQAGVPLNTVRDLLGHSSVAMSLRYAHLAPDQRCEAVAKLDKRPMFATSMRLPSRVVSPMVSAAGT